MYKLYYDTFPGNIIFPDENFCGDNPTGITENILSLLGIQYLLTNNKEDSNSIVIVNIESHDQENLLKIFELVSKNFPKAIVLSSSEPNQNNFNFDEIKKQYPNILFVCNGDHYSNILLNNVALFPFYILRPLLFNVDIKIHNLKDLNYLTSKKPFVFNHLSKHWTPPKYKMHYTIKEYSTVPNIVSYRPIDWKAAEPVRRIVMKNSYDRLKTDHEFLCDINKKYNNIYPFHDYINKCTPDHPGVYLEEVIDNDPLNVDYYIGGNTLHHLSEIYQKSYISLVTEIGKSQILFNGGSLSTYNLSEKIVQPILNNHIFIVNDAPGYNTKYLKNKLGFEIFEEMFDYDFIDRDGEHFVAYNIIQELNKFKPEMIFDNSKIIAEKIHYNRNLVINPSSSLRKMLKNAFEDILNKYLEMDP